MRNNRAFHYRRISQAASNDLVHYYWLSRWWEEKEEITRKRKNLILNFSSSPFVPHNTFKFNISSHLHTLKILKVYYTRFFSMCFWNIFFRRPLTNEIRSTNNHRPISLFSLFLTIDTCLTSVWLLSLGTTKAFYLSVRFVSELWYRR